ncbi:MAG TPA: hypothetical protein DHW82_05165 [Spirochaetia bacterium]|nr:MAG: hypothetical protein A2Y41_09490 [Spirochaetes bacterium GWB1_36_13]HCL56382.1 hypothetical protein [Spirochaetia bacterium]
MKKFFFLIFLIVSGVIAFFGLDRNKDDLILIADSKIRGRNIILPGKWFFYPERLVPGYFKLQALPKNMPFSDRLFLQLPKSKMIDFADIFKASVSYTADFNWDENTYSQLYQKEPSEMIRELKENIQDSFYEIFFENSENEVFSEAQLKNLLVERGAKLGIKLNISVLFFPDWKLYKENIRQFEEKINLSNPEIYGEVVKNSKEILSEKTKQKILKDKIKFYQDLQEEIKSFTNPELLFKIIELGKK